MVQYNVRTLGNQKTYYGRTEILNNYAALVRSQLSTQGIHVAGFQETRIKQTAIVSSHDWIRYTSAADDSGNGGCELWLSRTNSYTRC